MLQITIAPLYAKEKLDIDANFSFAVSDEMLFKDYYSIKAELEFEFEVTDKFEFTLELDADRFEVEADEISFKWKASSYLNILFGK